MKVLKSTGVALTGLVLALNMNFNSQSVSANYNATESIATEEGHIISIGEPSLKEFKLFKALTSSSSDLEYENEILNEEDLESITQKITVNTDKNDFSIEVPVELNQNESIILYEDEEGNTYNSANIVDLNGDSLAVIDITSEDALLSTSVNDNTLTIDVDSENNEPVEIQVMAAAASFGTYFSSGKWITRDGIVSLSLTHKPYLTSASDVGEAGVKKKDSWSKVKTRFSSSVNWKNTAGLEKQFNCHFDFAKFKNPWNIEPARPNTSYAHHVAKACNPPIK